MKKLCLPQTHSLDSRPRKILITRSFRTHTKPPEKLSDIGNFICKRHHLRLNASVSLSYVSKFENNIFFHVIQDLAMTLYTMRFFAWLIEFLYTSQIYMLFTIIFWSLPVCTQLSLRPPSSCLKLFFSERQIF